MSTKQKRTGKAGKALSPEVLEDAVSTLKLLAHPHRLKIIEIQESEPDGALVHNLTKLLGLPQATVSQHLGAMQRVGLLHGSRRSQKVWYKISDKRSLTILNCTRKWSEES